MKLAIVTDLHFGARGDSQIFDRYFEKFYTEVFFPYIDKHDIKTVFCLGDTFDRRKYINFVTLYNCRRYFFDQLDIRGIESHFIAGNHDEAYKNTAEVNSPELLLADYEKLHVYTGPQDVVLDGLSIAVIPWICSGNAKETFEFMETTKSQVAFGHLEISGFQMHRGSVSDHGYAMDLFRKFSMVFSGHFHHKSSYSNIHYLGAPYEITWADWDDPRGFHVFDTDTLDLEYIQNPHFIHHKIMYNDRDKTLDELLELIPDVTDSYVKIYAQDKTNPYWYDIFTDKVEKGGCISIQHVEDGVILDGDEDFMDDVEDTPTLLRKCCEAAEVSIDKNELSQFMLRLYNEALEIE